MMFLLVLITSLCYVSTRGEEKIALLIIDVQDCFLPGGSLAVKDGDQVIQVINRIRQNLKDHLDLVVLSQDWHCPDHVSFASQHPGKEVYAVVNLTYNSQGKLCFGKSVPPTFPHAVNCSTSETVRIIPQTLWPDHCILNISTGGTSSAFSSSLIRNDSDIVIRKGFECYIDSYSAFYNNGRFQQTELEGVLKQHGINTVIVTGLTSDYCVYYTCKDAHTFDYKVFVVVDATKPVAESSRVVAFEDMKNLGINLIQSDELLGVIQAANFVVPFTCTTTIAFLATAIGVIINTFY